MAEQSGERRVTAEIGQELISLMVPDMDPELVRLMLSNVARSAAGDHADREGHRDGGGKPPAAVLQEHVELLALIRDAGIDHAQLRVFLGLNPETLPTGDDNPHPPDSVTGRVSAGARSEPGYPSCGQEGTSGGL